MSRMKKALDAYTGNPRKKRLSRVWTFILTVGIAMTFTVRMSANNLQVEQLQERTYYQYLPLILAGSTPEHYTTLEGDVNGDRYLDRIRIGSRRITVGLSDGNGGLTFLEPQPNPVQASGAAEIFLRDVNEDGRADLIWKEPGVPDPVYVALGSASGALTFVKPANTLTMVRVIIERVRGLDCMDELGLICGSAPDFYAVVNIDGDESDNKISAIDDDDDISPNWQFFAMVDSTRVSVPVMIDIYDEDGGLRGDDDHVDLDPGSGRGLDLTVTLDPCSVSGDVSGSCETTLVSSGAQDDRAEIQFRIEVGPAAPVDATAVIERVKALDCIDEIGPICGSDPDFYAVVNIDGQEFDNKANAIDDDDDISPDWEFSKVVDFNRGTIPLDLDIYDEDGGLRFDDDHVDLTSAEGRTLDLSVDLGGCLTGAAGSVSGEVTGQCGQTLTSSGTANDRAQIWFRVEVEPPVTTPGTNVRCIHDPIWPQGNQPMTITAHALDGALAFKSVNVDIEVWLNDTSAPFATTSNLPSFSVAAGSYPAGSSMSYGCLVRDNTSGEVVWTGWRRVQIGQPPSGQAVPVLFTGSRSSRIDTVFIPDEDSYTGSGDTNFLSNIGDILLNGYFDEKVFLTNQDKMNFWIARDEGDAQDDCDSTAPDNWDEDYTFADTGAILHLDTSIRDCAPGGERFFSAFATSTRIILHETGHRPYGLADEYCCDGGYFQNEPYPNLYEEPEDCIADIPNLQVWDDRLGHPHRTTSDCREFMEPIEWWFDNDWSASDSPSDDLMVDTGTPRGADYRRIQWIFDQCASANCEASTAAVSIDGQKSALLVVDPSTEPVPEFDYDDTTKSVIVRLDFQNRQQVSFESATVVYGQPHVRLGDPPLLRIKLYDKEDNLVEEFKAWHPTWAFLWQDGDESLQIRTDQSGRFVFPFQPQLKRMEVADIPLGETLISTSLAPAIDTFCAENPHDPECQMDLALTKSDTPDPVVAGTPLTYTVTVVNNGPVGASGVTVTDTLPAGLTFDPAHSDPQCTASDGIVTCDLDALADGESAAVTITGDVDPAVTDGAVLTNLAVVAADQGDSDTSNNSGTAETTVIRRADLAVAKASNVSQVMTGDQLTYHISVTNNGPSIASGVTLTDVLPGGVSFESAVASHGTGCTFAGGVVTCDLGTLELEETATVTMVTTVGCSAAEMTNMVAVAGNEIDPVAENNQAAADVVLLADFGDAADPPYPTRLASDGAYHCDGRMEWLGVNVDYETDALFPDLSDDGVYLAPPHHQSPILAQVTIWTSGLGAERYSLEPGRSLYLRAWFDMNEDGDWDDPNELVIDCVLAPGTMGRCNGRPTNWENHTDRKFPIRLPIGPPRGRGGRLRFRLSYGVPVGPTGPSQYGEVEDYELMLSLPR